ncbi:hypothetical protein [Levilactobacillus cerevisiae]|uniref:hypothetical protein n=1 Tax=Levilactobacillus cerevisiae TaxID=1704076 RepID=UPI001CDBA70A|nr:hypothetical protein [Levilactobacillus cerevisiae]
MDMKKIVIAATLLSIVTGGEVSALAAKTTPHHAVAKITHVKISKHKVTGYTTAQSHVKLMKLKHHEQAETTANKHGKFTLKVKSNNLTKLKFKLKATHAGLKARTYTHKVKKHAQSIDESTTTETQTAPAPVKPQVSDDKKPEKNKDKPTSQGGVHYVPVKDWATIKQEVKKVSDDLKDAKSNVADLTNEKSDAKKNDSAFADLLSKKEAWDTAESNLSNADTAAKKQELEGKRDTAKTAYTAALNSDKAHSDAAKKLNDLNGRLKLAKQKVTELQHKADEIKGIFQESNPVPNVQQ